eukprot:scaffold28209_cov56-Isochrysis_galbana.AAC.1
MSVVRLEPATASPAKAFPHPVAAPLSGSTLCTRSATTKPSSLWQYLQTTRELHPSAHPQAGSFFGPCSGMSSCGPHVFYTRAANVPPPPPPLFLLS